jgi:tRNA-binding EMAP/Myf-like protein
MGLESKGMILALETEPGKHEVLMVNSSIKPGTRAK